MSRRVSHTRSVRRISRLLAVLIAVVAVGVSTVAPVEVATASASTSASSTLAKSAGDPAQSGIAKASLAGFNPGNIISDAVFTNKSTMTEAQIQSFFNSKVSKCVVGKDETGKPFVCLKDFKITSVNMPADGYCSGYKGAANETAARIIYKVAQACNINPQVLIVMLQKEQGLVTHVWPSAWRYDMALGQGCPDTAPCDPQFVGFFHQIYGAGRQMQIYMEGKWFTWYAPGKTWGILYHPNASCGRGNVYVANKATSALYYYTPYQPNAAALRAGYGEGDGCSSYGNRNFYNYFTDWFGSTQKPTITPTGAIATEWKRMGGASGALGNAVKVQQTVTDPNGNGVAQQFSGGWIHSSAAGTFSSLTPIMTAYSAAGWLRGELGWPVTQTVCTGGICTQAFAGGIISHASGKTATATLGVTPGSIDKEHAARGGANGVLGTALAAVQVVSDPNGNGLARKYSGGWIHSSAKGTFSSSAKIMTAYSAAGWLRGYLGWPVKAEQTVTDPNGNGVAQSFAGGWIHSSSAGSFASSSTVMTAYSAAGWVRGKLGWPTGAELCTGNTCTQPFQGGIISYTRGKAAVSAIGVTPKAIADAGAKQTGVTGSLGTAQGAVQVVADPNGGGLAQKFARGWVHSSSRGTFVSSPTVMTAYSSAGWLRGTLGWPTGVETCTGTVCSQAFEGGIISYTPGKAAVVLSGMSAAGVDAVRAGSAGVLGTALAAVQVVSDPNGNGLARKYSGGWIHSSVKGTFSSSAKIMTAYSAAGWLRGYLGWPVKAEQTVTDPNGNGTAQAFEGGWIHSSSKGSFASSSTVMKAYSAAGWLRGDLGWPIGAEVCKGDACTQAFQGGVISYTKGGNATVENTRVLVLSEFEWMHMEPSDAVELIEGLGDALGEVQPVTDENGDGFAREYTDGWVHSSEVGTFASSSTVMKAYSAAGWVRGDLGWPTGEEACADGECVQTFQGGTISHSEGESAIVTLQDGETPDD